jgi:hypothetical protein
VSVVAYLILFVLLFGSAVFPPMVPLLGVYVWVLWKIRRDNQRRAGVR